MLSHNIRLLLLGVLYLFVVVVVSVDLFLIIKDIFNNKIYIQTAASEQR